MRLAFLPLRLRDDGMVLHTAPPVAALPVPPGVHGLTGSQTDPSRTGAARALVGLTGARDGVSGPRTGGWASRGQTGTVGAGRGRTGAQGTGGRTGGF